MSEKVIGKNLFETYEVNNIQYTDNIPSDFLIGISKKEFIEYQQQKEEIERLNNIINELEKELNKDFNTYMTGNRQNGKVYKAGADNYRMHIYLKLQELKGSESNE